MTNTHTLLDEDKLEQLRRENIELKAKLYDMDVYVKSVFTEIDAMANVTGATTLQELRVKVEELAFSQKTPEEPEG